MGISGLAVSVAVVVGMVIAWVWYSDWGIFGTRWRSLTGITKEASLRAGKRPFVVLILAVVVTAVALPYACSAVSIALGPMPSGLT